MEFAGSRPGSLPQMGPHWQITSAAPFSGARSAQYLRFIPTFRTHAAPRPAVLAAAPQVAVVGGGVCGLTSALALLRRLPDAHVTIIAEKVADDTTSEGAAGLWKPFALSGTPPET